VLSPLVIDTATSGHDQIDFLVPRLYYDRLLRSHITIIKYKITIVDNIDHTFQNDQVWIELFGPPHRHLNTVAGDLAHDSGVDHLGQAAVIYGGTHEPPGLVATGGDHGLSSASDLWI
jgi:hypothetical protein